MINDLKTNGRIIPVDLEKCAIRENSYVEGRELYGHKNEMLTLGFEAQIKQWNAITGDAARNIEDVQVSQSVLIYVSADADGSEIKFVSDIIPKDKATVAMYLAQQKQTVIYVAKANSNRYYFDIEFMIDTVRE